MNRLREIESLSLSPRESVMYCPVYVLSCSVLSCVRRTSSARRRHVVATDAVQSVGRASVPGDGPDILLPRVRCGYSLARALI